MMPLHAMPGYRSWWTHDLIRAGVVVLAALALALAVAASAARSWAARWNPEQILKRRYAQGNVEKEEYERALADLRR